mmetsp:Transcript_8751/g.18285  ORF Transcript_8751/g.18285 Transcript_8751/m.18285 type:complete len:388 (+) Transcript_8751:270-1433(+)
MRPLGNSFATLAVLSTHSLLLSASSAQSPSKLPSASRAVIPMNRLDVLSRKKSILDHSKSSNGEKYFYINQLRGGSDGNSGSDAGGRIGDNINANNKYYRETSLDGGQSLPGSQNGQYFSQNGMPQQNNLLETTDIGSDPMMMYGQRETVEDRLAAWRMAQQERQKSQSIAEAASAIDEQGSFKLFTTVSRVSVSFFFFILMWRTVHHYELADATFGAASMGNRNKRGGVGQALLRAVIVTPLVILFLGEMMGAIFGLTGGGTSHATKKRLKGILNLHKGVELVVMVYNVVRLAIVPSKYTPREVYIGRTISNFFFLMQAQLYTKLSWDDVSKTNVADFPPESYYDDYTPETGNGEYGSWSGGNEFGYEQGPQYPQQQNYSNQNGWN